MGIESDSDSAEEYKAKAYRYTFSYYLPARGQYIYVEGKEGASMSKRYNLDFLCAPGEHITDAHTLAADLDVIVVLTDKMRLILVSRLIFDRVAEYLTSVSDSGKIDAAP